MIATSTQLKTHLAELQERSGMHHPDTYRAWNEYIDALVAEKQLDAAAAEFSALLTVQEQSYGEKAAKPYQSAADSLTSCIGQVTCGTPAHNSRSSKKSRHTTLGRNTSKPSTHKNK